MAEMKVGDHMVPGSSDAARAKHEAPFRVSTLGGGGGRLDTKHLTGELFALCRPACKRVQSQHLAHHCGNVVVDLGHSMGTCVVRICVHVCLCVCVSLHLHIHNK